MRAPPVSDWRSDRNLAIGEGLLPAVDPDARRACRSVQNGSSLKMSRTSASSFASMIHRPPSGLSLGTSRIEPGTSTRSFTRSRNSKCDFKSLSRSSPTLGLSSNCTMYSAWRVLVESGWGRARSLARRRAPQQLDVDLRREHDDALRRHPEELRGLRAAALQIGERPATLSPPMPGRGRARTRCQPRKIRAVRRRRCATRVAARRAAPRLTSGVSMKPKRARTACTSGVSSSTHARAARSWRGVRRISRCRITMCS